MTSRAEIEERLAAATPGPWAVVSGRAFRPLEVCSLEVSALGDEVGICLVYGGCLDDAELVAHAPDDLRYLLDVIDRLIKAGDDMADGLTILFGKRPVEWDEAKKGAA